MGKERDRLSVSRTNTDDISIFDWVGRPSTLNSYLSRSPARFHQPAEVPVLETVSGFTRKLSAALLRVAESLLNEPPLARFIANGRMNLRTFVHQVKFIELVTATEVQRRTVNRYHIKVDGLELITVVTTYELPDADFGVTARSPSTRRVWDNALRIVARKETYATTAASEPADEPLSDSPWALKNDDYLGIVAKRLREPFVAPWLSTRMGSFIELLRAYLLGCRYFAVF